LEESNRVREGQLRGEQEISDLLKAVFYQYEGALCIRCSTMGNSALWLFRVPEFDAEIIEEHFADQNITIEFHPFTKAWKAVESFRNQARHNMGEWISPLYAARAV
jgi:hypothetical protein